MKQCRNQNRPNTSLWSGVWNHNTYLAGIRKVIKLKRKYQVFSPSGGCHSVLGISLQNNLQEQEVSKSQCLPRKHPLKPLCTILALARVASTLETCMAPYLLTHCNSSYMGRIHRIKRYACPSGLVLLLINGSVDNRDAKIACPL